VNGRVLPFQPTAHATADALLPWYVNGTLHDEELSFVEEHVRGCVPCQREVEWLRQVFVACTTMTPLEGTDDADSRPSPAFRSEQRKEGWRTRMAEAWVPVQPWIRGAPPAQFVVIALLGALLAAEPRTAGDYRTLGTSARPVPAADAIAVIFDPAMTAGDMQRLVHGAGARIIDGPTATNVFVLDVPAGHADDALRALRAAPAVRFAEPLGARSQR